MAGLNTVFYRIWSRVKHSFCSWNTRGEGIHSPYLFYLVSMLIYDENAYYCFEEIERERRRLLRQTEELPMVDYGVGGLQQREYQRRVSDIARTSLESAKVGQILFRLVLWLGREAGRPLNIVELGTSLGVTTSYLAMANTRNNVTTFEGCPAVAERATGVWRRLGIENIECIEGNIDSTLFIHTRSRVDVAYLDANHTFEATIRYARHMLPLMDEKSVMILDDIHYSPEMYRAWQEVCSWPEVTSSMDLYDVGILFFDPHYLRRNYKLRI